MTGGSAAGVSYFVTGTDTGVGKTLVSAGLLHTLARQHRRVVGMKAVAAGGLMMVDGVFVNDDVLALRAASTCRVPAELDNPVLLREPVSPHLAARYEGVDIDIAHIVRCHKLLLTLADAVVVEGAGGFLVPLSSTTTGADLAQALNLPVLLVVGLQLGCLNHALLTAEAIAARGLKLVGWVANHIDPLMLAQAENIAFLQQRLAAPLLGVVPHQSAPDARSVNLTLP